MTQAAGGYRQNFWYDEAFRFFRLIVTAVGDTIARQVQRVLEETATAAETPVGTT